MSDTLEWRDLATGVAKRWWVPLVLALAVGGLGAYAATTVGGTHRAEATLLVGPLNSTVTRSTTLRASESLAAFYADVARREVVLVAVRRRLGLDLSLDDLRSSVSARVPDQNPRVVTVTVESGQERRSEAIAQAVVDELVSLSPPATGVTEPVFVSEQADALEVTIQEAEDEVDRLRTSLAATVDPAASESLDRRISAEQQFLNESRQTYVELMSLEPESDAGGLTVLDDVAPVAGVGRVSPVTGAALGVVVGTVLGLLVLWLVDRRRRAPVPEMAETPPIPTVNLVVRPTAGLSGRRLPRSPPRRSLLTPDRRREGVNGRADR